MGFETKSIFFFFTMPYSVKILLNGYSCIYFDSCEQRLIISGILSPMNNNEGTKAKEFWQAGLYAVRVVCLQYTSRPREYSTILSHHKLATGILT